MTTELGGLLRQVVFHNRRNKHDFGKNWAREMMKLMWFWWDFPGHINQVPLYLVKDIIHLFRNIIYFGKVCFWKHALRNPVGGVGGCSKVVATFCHVGGSFNLFMATTGDVWIISSFWIWDYVLHVEHVSCVITNCDQHQWVIPSPLSLAL